MWIYLLKEVFCFIFLNQVHLLWWPSLCHGSTPLWSHPSRHHQGHCYSVCPPEWLPCGPALWLGLSRPSCGKNFSFLYIVQVWFCWEFCRDLNTDLWVIYVSYVLCCRSMRLIKLWGSKDPKMWPRWALLSTTSSAETLSWDMPTSGRWVYREEYYSPVTELCNFSYETTLISVFICVCFPSINIQNM